MQLYSHQNAFNQVQNASQLYGLRIPKYEVITFELKKYGKEWLPQLPYGI